MRIRTAVSLIVCSLLPVGISLAWGLHATGSATRASTSRESFLNDPSRAVSALAPQPAVSPSVAEPPLATSDWPSQRGDLGRRGHSDEQLDASALTEAWTWHSASPPEPAWPGPARWDAFAKLPGLKSMRNYDPAFHVSAEGDAVYFGSSSDDAVRCLDATSGEQRWLFRSGGPVRVAPTVFGSHVYFGSDDGAAYCLNKKSGELVWRHDLMPNATRILCNARLISPWPIRTGVHVADGVAYFGASLLPWRPSYLCAVDAKTGGAPEIGERDGTRFVRDLGTGWSLEGALLVSAESLIVPQGRIAPLIFERATGNPQGTLEGGGGSFCLLTENDQVLHGPGNKDGWITASEAGSRAKLASFSRGNAIVVRDKTAYMLSDSRLAALDISTQTLLWSRAVQTPFEIILAGDTLYCAGDGIVEARELSDGRLLWRGDVLGRVWGLAVARGRLLVSTDRGCISAFEAGDTKIPQPDERVVDEEGTELEPPPPVAKNLRSSTLLDRWVFQSDHLRETELAEDDPRTAPAFVNLGKGLAIRPVGRTQLQQAGALHALALDGRSGDLEVCSDMHQVAHPEKKISVTTTVRIDRAQAWGGLIGMAQDNGEYERGWMLGFRENRFGFALASKEGTGRLTWLLAPDGFTLGSWHVVTGTYDGRTMKLFVDGAEVASSAAESGDINYPETAYYHIGAYRDADEYFRVSGCIAELSVHAAALSSKDVAKLWNERKALLPRPVAVGEVKREEKPLLHSLKLARKASVRFIGPGRALVEWQLAEEASVNLHVTPEGGESAVIAGSGKTHNHSVLLSGLRDQTVYECVIISEDGKAFSKSFECD
ncbi:MAG: outer membrane protein assembly factor BamB, partial [Planctomycetota bacterium]